MKDFEEEIDRRLAEYTAALSAAEKVLQFRKATDNPQSVKLLAAKLHAAKCQGIWQYYLISEETGNRRKYLPVAQRALAADIAQRDYALLVSKKVRHWQKKLQAARRLISETASVAEIPCLFHISAGRQVLIKPFQLTDAQYAQLWAQQSFIQKKMMSGTVTFQTNRGEQVRSKSEKIIADWLLLHHIPYRYEQQLKLSSSFMVHPDFTVLNTDTRKEVYIEHLGMMDDPRYADTAVMKINRYQLAGYRMGIDVLFTFETKTQPLDTAVLNKALAFLIPHQK